MYCLSDYAAGIVQVSVRSYASLVGNRRAAVLTFMIVSGAGIFVFATVFAVLPELQFAYRGASVHVALETAATLIALIAGFLVLGRLRRRGSLNDLLLACALAVLALLNVCLLTIAPLAHLLSMGVIVWILLIGRSLCALLFALAAFVPDRRLRGSGLVLAVSVAGGSAVVLLTAVLLNGLAGPLTHRLAVALAPTSSEQPGPSGHLAALLTLQLAATLLYGTATVGFIRRYLQSRDEFLGWLAVAGILAGLSHLNYSLYPSPYAPMIHVGDIFRFCFYTTLLVASMREISSYWHALSKAAVSQERERIARDLHDGLAQELACLARNLDSLDGDRGETLSVMRGAVQRAQLESRRVVSALAEPDARPIELALAEAAAEVAEQFHIGLQLDLPSGVRVSAARGDALVRIAREACANAARYSGAGQVKLALERDGSRLRLRVSDQGRGFDPAVTRGGYGLISMRQRAHSVGGELRICSAPGKGSEVEALL
jgi:signal transduction histidine kinase